MSIASQLFYSTDLEKETLYSRIIPSKKQQDSQQERWNDLCDYLSGDLADITGLPIYSWLQGSYKFKTQIRPASKKEEFDIDLGIYFDWQGNPEDGAYTPSNLKSIVQDSLLRYQREAGGDVIEVVSPAKNRCCRIRFTEDFHIDVPVYHLDSSRDARALATEEDIWEASDPKALYEWFKNQREDDASSAQIRRLVRYIKMWAALNLKEDKRTSTIVLTVLIVEAFNSLSLNGAEGEDKIFNLCIKSILERLGNDRRIENPVDRTENLNRLNNEAFDEFIACLEALEDIADRGLVAQTEIESATIWQEAFFQFFPFPAPQESDTTTLALVPVSFDPQVSITATPKDNNYRVSYGVNEIGPIPKECNITFSITNFNNLPAGAKAQWIARNEGEEAEYENDMGHRVIEEGFIIEDHSAYTGTHFMDLVIKSRFNTILGFRRIPVKVTGMAMPPRNPKRKPGFRYKKR